MTAPVANPIRRGESTWVRAAIRLRKDRAAIASLGWLFGVIALAVAAPLLPLQPPDRDDTSLQYATPLASPFWIPTFALDQQAIDQAHATAQRLEGEIPQLATAYEQTRRVDPEQAERAWEALDRQRAALADAIQRPYRAAGFPELGLVSRLFVRWRYELFGDWSVNSLCGRDLLGRDLLSRIFWGARTSLLVGLVATLVSLLIGVAWGAVAGYSGGWVDNALMRIVDVLYSVPFIFVVIFITSVLNEDRLARRLESYGIDKIALFYLVVGAIYWLTMARVVRGQIISLKTEPFVEAARAVGASRRRILLLHLLPNVTSVVVVYLTLTIPRVMLFEAFLSFLGLGVEAPDVSWGLLAKEGMDVITPVRIYWWLMLFPNAALGATLLALNFLGDGLRDALDPKLRDR